MPRSTALHMSYRVSAATPAAVSASISTPVAPFVSTVARIRTPSPTGSNSTLACVSASGWQSGMRSLVRLAAMMPATRATANTSPLGARPSTIIASVSGRMWTTALRDRPAVGDRLPGHVHHPRGAVLVDVGEMLLAHRLASDLRHPAEACRRACCATRASPPRAASMSERRSASVPWRSTWRASKLVVREEACPQLAVGGQPQPVAVGCRRGATGAR